MIYVLDIWPACLAAMQVYEGSLLYALMKRVSKWVYQKADVLLISSKRFQQYMQTVHHISVPDDCYVPQFPDRQFDDVPRTEKEREENQKEYHFVFAGNIGRMQGVQTLLEAAVLLRQEPIHWHFLGDGSDFEACVALMKAHQLEEQVTFYGRRPLTDMPQFYEMADAMLVSMRNDISVNDTLPGKVQSYMAAAKPILGSITGETPYIIEEASCGFCAKPEDARAFADVVLAFMASSKQREMGENAKKYYEQHFTQQRHMDRLESVLLQLSGKEA